MIRRLRQKLIKYSFTFQFQRLKIFGIVYNIGPKQSKPFQKMMKCWSFMFIRFRYNPYISILRRIRECLKTNPTHCVFCSLYEKVANDQLCNLVQLNHKVFESDNQTDLINHIKDSFISPKGLLKGGLTVQSNLSTTTTQGTPKNWPLYRGGVYSKKLALTQ